MMNGEERQIYLQILFNKIGNFQYFNNRRAFQTLKIDANGFLMALI